MNKPENIPHKIKNRTTCDPAIPFSDVVQRKQKHTSFNIYVHHYVHCGSIQDGQYGANQCVYLQMNEYGRCIHIKYRILLSHKKN